MSKYYKLEKDWEKVGCYPQATTIGGTINLNEPNSIWHVEHNKLPSFIPNLNHIPVRNCAKLTDFISWVPISFGFIVSQKAKEVFEQFDLGIHAFYPARVVHKQKTYDNYFWLLWEFPDVLPNIEYIKSKFYLGDMDDKKIKDLNINSSNDLIQITESIEDLVSIIPELLSINDKFLSNFDVMKLPFEHYPKIITQKLAQSLEENKITGIRIREYEPLTIK